MSYRGAHHSYDQNVGVVGVVYILQNEGFKDDFLKIGSTRHSGQYRADQINKEASTGIPACFKCTFQLRVLDCGTAERRVHARLRSFRRGRHGMRYGKAWGQEFFQIDAQTAEDVIRAVCREVNEEVAQAERVREQEATARRVAALQALRAMDGDAVDGAGRQDASPNEKADYTAETGPSSAATGGGVRPWPPREAQAGVAWSQVGAIAVALCVGFALLSNAGRSRPATAVPVPDSAHSKLLVRSPTAVASTSDESLPPPGQQPGTAAVAAVPPVFDAAPTEDRSLGERAGLRQQPFPPGGSTFYFSGKPDVQAAAGSLRLYAPASSLNRYAVMVVRVPSDSVYAQAFLEPNDVADVVLPEGRFRLAFATGMQWFGTRPMFGPGHEAVAIEAEINARRGTGTLRMELPLK